MSTLRFAGRRPARSCLAAGFRPGWLLLLFSFLLSAACESSSPGPGPNVLLVTLDTTRADRLGAMGYAGARTPVLDALARRGVLFEKAYASSSLTLPSHTTILTGLDPDQHGVHDNAHSQALPSLRTLAEEFQSAGYRTAAFVAAVVLDRSFGLDQGFGLYDDRIVRSEAAFDFEVGSRDAAEVNAAVLPWLEGVGEAPFFLWVHYYDVHAPRAAPPPHDSLEDPYDGELAFVDAAIGQLLEQVEEHSRETLIVVAADHGEALGEHGETTHGVLAYDATLHIPMILAGPDLPEGRRIDEFVRTVDVAPTILKAAGLAPLPGMRGQDLQDVVAGEGDENPLGYFESLGPSLNLGWQPIRGVRDSRWKLTLEPLPPELYDTREDAAEVENRFERFPDVVAKLQQAAKDEKLGSVAPADPHRGHTDPRLQERLESLGYVAIASKPPEGQAPTDPRRYVAAIGLVEVSRALATEGHYGDAIDALEILGNAPVIRPLVLSSLGPLYTRVGRFDDAAAVYRELVRGPEDRANQRKLALALLAAEQFAEADIVLTSLLEVVDSDREEVLVLAASSRLAAGDREAALAWLSRALVENPRSPSALALDATIRAAQGDPALQLERVKVALAQTDPARAADLRLAAAEILADLGQDRQALEVLRTEGADRRERMMRAEILARRGRLEDAISLYQQLLADTPGTFLVYEALADLHQRNEDPASACAVYDILVSLRPENPGLWLNRGGCHAALGERPAARIDYEKSLALDPRLAEGYLNLALLDLAEGNATDAEARLLEAVRWQPGNAKAHFHLARIYKDRADSRAAFHAEQASVGMGGLSPLPAR